MIYLSIHLDRLQLREALRYCQPTLSLGATEAEAYYNGVASSLAKAKREHLQHLNPGHDVYMVLDSENQRQDQRARLATPAEGSRTHTRGFTASTLTATLPRRTTVQAPVSAISTGHFSVGGVTVPRLSDHDRFADPLARSFDAARRDATSNWSTMREREIEEYERWSESIPAPTKPDPPSAASNSSRDMQVDLPAAQALPPLAPPPTIPGITIDPILTELTLEGGQDSPGAEEQRAFAHLRTPSPGAAGGGMPTSSQSIGANSGFFVDLSQGPPVDPQPLGRVLRASETQTQVTATTVADHEARATRSEGDPDDGRDSSDDWDEEDADRVRPESPEVHIPDRSHKRSLSEIDEDETAASDPDVPANATCVSSTPANALGRPSDPSAPKKPAGFEYARPQNRLPPAAPEFQAPR